MPIDSRSTGFTRLIAHWCAKAFAWLTLLSVLSACSTSALHQAREQFYSGNSEAALVTLASSEAVSSSDRLLYLLEKGLILHDSGDYEASSRELLAAVEYLDEYDYISLADEAKALLANDWVTRYKGEYSERLWVHSYLMMNFLSLGRYDSAAVEARRALDRIETHGGVLENDHYTRTLIGLSFEAAGQLNDAYIEYRKLAELLRSNVTLDAQLYRMSSRLGFASDSLFYKRRLQEAGEFEAVKDKPIGGEAIVFLSNGSIPRKISDSIVTDYSERISFPRYYLGRSAPPSVTALVNGESCKCVTVGSDLGRIVSESLTQRAATLTAKAVVRTVVKDAVSEAIKEKDELAGEMVRLLLYALEEADTRSWQSLPRHMNLLRVPLAAKNATVSLSVSGSGGTQVIPLTENTNAHATGHTTDHSKAVTRGSVPLQFYRLRLPGRS